MRQPVLHPGGFQVQLPQPLDFSVVMDHSEYTGALVMADDPDSPLRKDSPITASMLRFGSWANGMDLYKLLSVSIVKDRPIKELQGPEVAGLAWKRLAGIAERCNLPGVFTTIQTTVGGTPYEVSACKLGDKLVAARSEEYSFASYELEVLGA